MDSDRQADPYGRGSYCIVVALHGDSSREAEILREFRDRFLKRIPGGNRMVELYYRTSSRLAPRERNSFTGSVLSSSVSAFAGFLSVLGL